MRVSTKKKREKEIGTEERKIEEVLYTFVHESEEKSKTQCDALQNSEQVAQVYIKCILR